MKKVKKIFTGHAKRVIGYANKYTFLLNTVMILHTIHDSTIYLLLCWPLGDPTITITISSITM